MELKSVGAGSSVVLVCFLDPLGNECRERREKGSSCVPNEAGQ